MWISVAESVQVLKKRGLVAFWHAREQQNVSKGNKPIVFPHLFQYGPSPQWFDRNYTGLGSKV
jgi:hypothetical protein